MFPKFFVDTAFENLQDRAQSLPKVFQDRLEICKTCPARKLIICSTQVKVRHIHKHGIVRGDGRTLNQSITTNCPKGHW